MGLISWIKNTYYDHKLSSADKLVENHNFTKAQQIYESLLGKQPLADAHLAWMLVSNATSVSEKLEILKRLNDLRQYNSDESKSDFDSILGNHVSSMESMASTSFANGRYSDAVNLLSAIRHYRSGQAFDDKLNKYNAYLSFERSERDSLSSHNLFSDTVRYLNQISSVPVSDIKQFLTNLEKLHKFHRAIKLSAQFLNAGNWVKDTIFKFVVEIISNNDNETKNIKALKDICTDKTLCKDIANDLSKRAREKAQKKDYKAAVSFAGFAADYLSEDNGFNVERCKYILEELSARADVNEIKALQKLAKSLKLTDSQINQLDNRIREIAVATSPAKGIAICRLYLGQSDFDKVYLEKALALAKSGSGLALTELRTVIKNQTNESTLPNVLGSFVPYLPALEKEFVDAAIIAIKSNDSTELLDKYWKIKNDTKFFTSIVNEPFKSWQKFASHIAKQDETYLSGKKTLDVFCIALSECGDLEFCLSTIENLIAKKHDVNTFYVKTILSASKAQDSDEASLDLINRAISHISDKSLLNAKKKLIANLIANKKFDRAESEIKSILSLDEEASTLLAELYFCRAKASDDADEKTDWFFKVLDVNEGHTLHERFLQCLQDTLSDLTVLSKDYCKAGNKEKAYRIADRISTYSAHWIPLYVWLRSWDREGEMCLNDRIKHYAETLKTIVSKCPNCREFDSELFRGEWDCYASTTIRKAQSQPKEKAIESLSKLRKAVRSFAPVQYVQDKENELTKLIVKLKWEYANELEHELSYPNAISLYDEIVSEKVQSYVNRAELRSLICHVKAGDVSESVEKRIHEALQLPSYQALREDLAYRFACYLLEVTRPSDAESILKEFLPDEEALLDMCENIYVKEAELKLAEFNSLLNKINEGKMTVAEAIEFKSSVRDFKKQIAGKLTDLSRSFGQIIPKVEAYILHKMFEEEAYGDLLTKLMAENPNYVENDTDFRNIAIASLGIIESDINDEATLKRAIATCLTAIYSDRLFVQSLDYTSWDDKFTFTLDGSLGRTNYDDYDELPENVNFDTPVDNVNVAIRDVQNSLLTRVETSVRKFHPELEKFCNEEKDALNKIIELNLDKDYILASPQLCRTLASIRISIENAFAYEIDQDYGNQEDVIALGSAYGFTGREYDEYNKGYNALLFCKSALSPRPTVTVNAAFTADKIAAIKRFNRLFSDLKSTVGTEMNNDTRADMDFKAFLNKYEPVCKAVGDTTLSLTCSNYVNGKVVHLLNEDQMQLRDGVGYMVRIYNIAPSNFQAKKNLEGILSGLAIQAEHNGNSADKNALSRAMYDTNNAFKRVVDEATIQAQLSIIVDKVNSGKMKNNTALSEVYKLYQKNPNNDRICENLATVCEACIFEYVMEGAYGSQGVKNTLNAIARNMSPTFKAKAKKLGKTFNEMWSNIPADTKNLMCGGIVINQSLNAKGEELKLGLQYLKKLGTVTQSTVNPYGLSSAFYKTVLPDLPL